VAQLALKGQDVALAIMQAGNVVATLTEIVSFNATFKFTKLIQRYLGETTIRPDEIFEGIEGKSKIHLYTDDFLNYIVGIQNRARRTTPSVVFNFVSTLNFPNGDTPTVSFPDVFFGDIPLDMPGGKEYVAMDLDWVCGEFDITNL
jgi:hypothetical protein